MMTHFLLFALLGCEPMPSSGNPFQPVQSTAAGPAAAPTTPQGSFDFDAADRQEDAVRAEESELDERALQARLLGIPVEELELEATAAAPATAPALAPQVPAPVAAPTMLWDPAQPLPNAGSWGVRLLGTLTELQPPRAILGLPNGEEVVVEPGALLPEHSLVVIAVGQDVIQIAEVKKRGFYASIETKTLSSLYPTRPLAPTE